MDKMAAETFRQQQIAKAATEAQQQLAEQTNKTRLAEIRARDLANQELQSRKLTEQYQISDTLLTVTGPTRPSPSQSRSVTRTRTMTKTRTVS